MNFEPKLQAPAPFGGNHHGLEASSLLPSQAQEPEANADALGAAWLDMLDGQEQGEHHVDTANDTSCPQNGISTAKVAREMGNAGAKEETKDDDDDDDLEACKHEKLMNVYESEHAVVPVGALMAEASSLGSVFEQFDVLGPDPQMDCAAASPVPRQTPGQSNERPRRRSLLEAEARKNRGASNKQRFLLAKRLSNISGGRVPFNFRYRVLDVDIRDPKNKPYEDAYKEGVAKKRESFKRKFNKSYLVGGGSP
ncbi:hypothetical protein TRSC58_04894 [Trypanosoma rangeli SC58]|uniref:Uncharacterized protein n=1 Tax=Trypanosoma rangeli SC58 TaxID=429131 RepID=A0A061IZV2_TRYRA|nr:hypothetical protein TRSC58_04894 [Trypanosoma rangeli SC58]